MPNLCAKTVDYIINRRKELKLTQSKVAKHIGVTERTYRRMETGSIKLTELEDLSGKLEFDMVFVPKGSVVWIQQE